MVALLKEVDDICSIHTAHNYDEASLLLDKKPDLVLLDIHLPGKNGIDVLKRTKKSSVDCEVMMVTNSVSEFYREQCMKLGASFFFDKTNDFDLVPVKIKEYASKGISNSGCYDKAAAMPN